MTKEELTQTDSAVENRIQCELCDAHYEAKEGSTNDCPVCGAPGGKGKSVISPVGSSEVGSQQVSRALNQLNLAVAKLSERVATLEQSAKKTE